MLWSAWRVAVVAGVSHYRRFLNRLTWGARSREFEPLDWQAVSDGDAFADLGGEL